MTTSNGSLVLPVSLLLLLPLLLLLLAKLTFDVLVHTDLIEPCSTKLPFCMNSNSNNRKSATVAAVNECASANFPNLCHGSV
jgi:hypothetical protein